MGLSHFRRKYGKHSDAGSSAARCHWVCDYPLQGDFLATAKQKGPLRFYHLVAHAGIHGAAVALVTGNVWLGLAEWLAHTVIDELKVRGRSTFALDQALHIVCKAVWLLIAVGAA